MAARRDTQAGLFSHQMERFQTEVVAPVLEKLVPIPNTSRGGPRRTIVQTARDNSHNSLCYTARLSFALTLGAAFERNLRFWLGQADPLRREAIHRAARPGLLAYLRDLKRIDLDRTPMAADLSELWEVTTMARHGDGLAAGRAAVLNPGLWDHNDPALQTLYDDAGLRVHSARVSDQDLGRYFSAVIGFWRLAERSGPPRPAS